MIDILLAAILCFTASVFMYYIGRINGLSEKTNNDIGDFIDYLTKQGYLKVRKLDDGSEYIVPINELIQEYENGRKKNLSKETEDS
jgi:hypothetical protein